MLDSLGREPIANRSNMDFPISFKALVENTLDMIVLCNQDNIVRYVTPAVRAMLGYTQEELIGMDVATIVHPDDLELFGHAIIHQVQNSTGPFDLIESRYRHKDGSWRYLETTVNVLLDDPEVRGIVCCCRDVTQRYHTEPIDERWKQIVQMSPDPIMVVTDEILMYANPATFELLGADRESLLGQSVLRIVHPDFRSLARTRLQLAQNKGQTLDLIEQRLLRSDGTTIYVEIRSAPIMFLGKPSVQTIVRDISRRKALEEKLNYLAYHDALTGLPNRSMFVSRLKQAVATSQQYGSLFAVLFIDMDTFKSVNDTFGHSMGDKVLLIISKRMRACLDSEDVLARFSGDEFCVLLESVTSLEDTTKVATRLLSALELPIGLDGSVVCLTASIGVAFGAPDPGMPTESFIREADAAMYRAKKEGKASFRLNKINIGAQ